MLEQQDPHSKGRFIANAILHYVHCSETPDISVRYMPDRVAIEAIVLDILCRQKCDTELAAKVSRPYVEQEEPVQEKISLSPEPAADEPKFSDIDEDVRTIIKGTLSAFRINN